MRQTHCEIVDYHLERHGSKHLDDDLPTYEDAVHKFSILEKRWCATEGRPLPYLEWEEVHVTGRIPFVMKVNMSAFNMIAPPFERVAPEIPGREVWLGDWRWMFREVREVMREVAPKIPGQEVWLGDWGWMFGEEEVQGEVQEVVQEEREDKEPGGASILPLLNAFSEHAKPKTGEEEAENNEPGGVSIIGYLNTSSESTYPEEESENQESDEEEDNEPGGVLLLPPLNTSSECPYPQFLPSFSWARQRILANGCDMNGRLRGEGVAMKQIALENL